MQGLKDHYFGFISNKLLNGFAQWPERQGRGGLRGITSKVQRLKCQRPTLQPSSKVKFLKHLMSGLKKGLSSPSHSNF